MSLVREFHLAFNLPAPSAVPLLPDPTMVRMRSRLILEETAEVEEELAALARAGRHDRVREVLPRLLKELADLRYVVDGCAVSLGLDIDAAVAEVHRSNMSKLGRDGLPIKRADGKVLKGPDYVEADMTRVIEPVIDIQEET